MLIAQQKRKDNIAEYILYMWQVEDTIRACQFNMDLIEKRVISQYTENKAKKQDISDWYANIIVMMHEQGIKKSGHLATLNSLVDKLNKLHRKLLNQKHDPKYLEQYYWALPNIRDFEKRLGRKAVNDVDTCLTAIYALLLLRLQKKEISKETLEAMQTFSNLLAVLAKWYKKIEEGGAEL
jgi:predicted unusual protein kinase regulating ubiquinone biosynthesis (AarF/ABC1/UbiB family)